MAEGLVENFILSALYTYSKDGIVLIMLATHVDDCVWGNLPEVEHIMDRIKKILSFGKLGEFMFRFCGLEIYQSREDFSIRVTCEETTKKMKQIFLPPHRRSDVDSPCLPEEKADLWSIVGSLMWISRSCRPGLSYRTSSLQSICRAPFISDILEANKVVDHCMEDPKVGITYRPGLRWPTEPGDEMELSVVPVSDASHGNEEIYLDEWECREAFRSQGAKLVFLGDKKIATSDEAFVHLLSFASVIQPRVVNSTIKAESYQLSNVLESAHIIRAAIADCHGRLDRKNWEDSAAAYMTCVWFTDCKSCYDTLQKPIAKSVDKRLGIELSSLRQYLWRDSGSHLPDKRMLELKPPNPSDSIRWIDTLVMVADCLTKAMRDDYLMNVLQTNVWNFVQTEEAKAIKTRKSEQRARKRDEKNEAKAR